MSLLGRIIVIIAAVMLACIAASMAVAIGLLGAGWFWFPEPVGAHAGFVVATLVGATLIGALGLLPLVILIVLAEAFKIRSLLAYASAGAILFALGLYASDLMPGVYEESIDHPASLLAHELQLAAAAGAVFGFVYWLLAGRNAGRWSERRSPAA